MRSELDSVGPVDVITITPEDLTAAREVLPDVLKDPAVAARFGPVRDHAGRVLAYFVPIDYTMEGMIADYVLHPVAHLAEGRTLASPADDFGIAVTRRPLFFVDVHLHTKEVLAVRDTPPGSGWGTVPTPVF